MADIEKGLPNTRSKIEIPSEEELQEVAVQDENVEELKGPVEVTFMGNCLPQEPAVVPRSATSTKALTV